MIKFQIQDALKDVLEELGVSDTEPVIERPSDISNGDYSTNIALVASKKIGKNPRELAEEIVAKFKVHSSKFIILDKVETAGAGFINFWISKEELIKNIGQASPAGRQGVNGEVIDENRLAGKKIMVEYGDANTHKFPHIGHLFSYMYGESIVRILSAASADVRRVSYQGDVGLHVAKCLWAFRKEAPSEPDSIDEKILLLQKMYQLGSQAFADSIDIKEEIKKLNKSIYDKDPSIYELYVKTREWSIQYYEKFEKRLGISYERHYFESEVYEKGREIVEENLGTVFMKSEGALIFKGSEHGLHDRVFVTQYGTPTYEAKDMYLQKLKMDEWPMDLLIITTASEQNGYFQVVFKALEQLDEKYKNKLLHLGFGMVNLKSGKMSSRTGDIIGAEDLINLTVDRVREVISEREDLKKKEVEQIAEVVGIGAIKYSFLKSNYAQNIQFDLEESISLEGNSGPYLQYTYARTQSVLRKAESSEFRVQSSEFSLELEEESLLRMLYFFDETVIEAAQKYSPNIIANYLYTLAQVFNLFYQKHSILKVDGEVKDFRLALTNSVGDTIKKGLELLGIETPEKM